MEVMESGVEGQEVAAPAVSEDSSLFSIDTAGAVKRDSPEEEVQLWTCALCQVTIKVRGDGRAEVTHVFGKPHRKKMRAAGLDEKAAEALVGVGAIDVGGDDVDAISRSLRDYASPSSVQTITRAVDPLRVPQWRDFAQGLQDVVAQVTRR